MNVLERRGLFRSDILACLQDPVTFIDLIGREFYEHGQSHDCYVVCSEMRLLHAQKFFVEDLARIRAERMPDGTEALDHFKVGAFVGFWLRRMLPINSISFLETGSGRIDFDSSDMSGLTDQHTFFSVYGNEWSAFNVAFDIVNYCWIENQKKLRNTSVVELVSGPVGRVWPSDRTVKEIVVTLKHKNNSPHSLYVILLSLFENLGPRHESIAHS